MTSLGAMLSARAEDGKGTVRFLSGEGPDEVLTVQELAQQAARVAGRLRSLGLKQGDRLALLLRSNLDFARIFLGASALGVTPIALYPPASLKRLDHYLKNLTGILDVVRPAGVIAAPEVMQVLSLVRADLRANVLVMGIEEALRPEAPAPFVAADPESPAFIQCTSGSTSVPKPVVVTHQSLFSNLVALEKHSGREQDDCMVLWLPMFHDMGLLGLLRPLYHNHSLVLMEPQIFLRKPARWLRAFSDHKGTMGGAPSFAYDLCVRKVPAEEREGLDLSSWRLAYNGAEPIRASVVRKFLEAYEPHGFRREAFVPCYGMSELTLVASLPAHREPVLGRTFQRRSLNAGEALEAGEGDAAADCVELVGVGRALPDHDLKIIDVDTRSPLPEGRIGTVVVTGPSLSSGYLNLPDVTRRAFDGWIKGDDRTWFFTNDRGFYHRGELFILGRTDDMIILRGRNIYPEDVEEVVSAVPGIRKGCIAVVPTGSGDDEGLAVVTETVGPPAEELERELRGAVMASIGVMPKRVVFVPQNTVPKTSSGKISRRAVRQALSDGTFERPPRPQWVQRAALMARLALGRLRLALRRIEDRLGSS